MRGRWIAENTVIAQEIVHKIRKHKGKKGLMLMKMDKKKAYDRMEWTFLIRILRTWGFDEHFIKLVYSCLNTTKFSLLLNGNISNRIKPEKGLRQGDPLSPILFILGSEVLARLLMKEELDGNLHGIKVARNSPTISNLMYADDLLVMSRVGQSEAKAFHKCFEVYCGWSGQTPNLEKSNIIFFKNICRRIKSQGCNRLKGNGFLDNLLGEFSSDGTELYKGVHYHQSP